MSIGLGACLAFTKTAATGATSVTFDVGGAYDSYMIVIPSMASGTGLQFRLCATASGTYRTLFEDRESTSPTTSAPIAYAIASSVTNCCFRVPHLAQYFQIALGTATTGTSYEFTVICSSI